MPKSNVRTKIEKAVTRAGINVDRTAWGDKSQSGWRIKFGFLQLSEKQMSTIRRELRVEFPDQDFRVWYVTPAHNYAIGGTAIKVFN